MSKINLLTLLFLCIFSEASVFAMEKPDIKTCCEGHFNNSIECLLECLEDEASYLEYARSNEELANVEAAMKEIWEVVEAWHEYTDAYTLKRSISCDTIKYYDVRIKAALAAHNL